MVIVRVDDLAVSADQALAPRDALHILEDRMPELHERLQAERVVAQEKLQRKTKKEEKGMTR